MVQAIIHLLVSIIECDPSMSIMFNLYYLRLENSLLAVAESDPHTRSLVREICRLIFYV